ncbi:MAG: type II toxin-antitoxin system Phd/YefM family antitoxin [Actinomycetota bacterium]
MTSISQRELRKDNAEIMRNVERGESYIVTRRGVPVARLSPVTQQSELPCARPAVARPVYSDLPRVRFDVIIATVLDELRGER